MHVPDWLVFFQRNLPSANIILLRTARPILIDTGFGSDRQQTEQLLRMAGVPPEQLHLIVNTHYHSDHTGGNNYFQQHYSLPIAAHEHDATLINQRDPDACRAAWLDQPVEPYTVDISLTDGSEIDAGEIVLQVIHTPGHTQGHVVLYEPTHGIMISGDMLQRDDVAWMNWFNEGPDAVRQTMASLGRLAHLLPKQAYAGHGPPTPNPLDAIDMACRRYERWLATPERMAWHACKRLFAYALIVFNGLPEAEVGPYLMQCPWFHDYSQHGFGLQPEAFIQPLLAEMLRSHAAEWHNGRLIATVTYTPPPANWWSAATRPADWPAGTV